MAAPVANDRKLAGEVRRLALRQIQSILLGEKDDKYSQDFKNQLLLKLAGQVLPRINEGSGENGEFEVKTTLVKFIGDEPSNNGNTEGVQAII